MKNVKIYINESRAVRWRFNCLYKRHLSNQFRLHRGDVASRTVPSRHICQFQIVDKSTSSLKLNKQAPNRLN